MPYDLSSRCAEGGRGWGRLGFLGRVWGIGVYFKEDGVGMGAQNIIFREDGVYFRCTYR